VLYSVLYSVPYSVPYSVFILSCKPKFRSPTTAHMQSRICHKVGFQKIRKVQFVKLTAKPQHNCSLFRLSQLSVLRCLAQYGAVKQRIVLWCGVCVCVCGVCVCGVCVCGVCVSVRCV
jgi:hypothetical protein